MFNENNFKQFIKTKIKWMGDRKASIQEDDLLNAMCIFTQSLPISLNKKSSSCNTLLGKIFQLTNKPTCIQYNHYFLYLFKYKWCSRKKHIEHINNFGKCKTRWNNLDDTCYNCRINKRQNSFEQRKEYNENYRKNNREYFANQQAKRRAAKLNATLTWLTKQDLIEIEDVYYQSQEYTRLLNEEYQVDHIVPLQGKNVCGLHVPWNLQILTTTENIKKSNRLIDNL